MTPAHPAYCKRLTTTLLMLCVVLLCTAQSVFNRTYVEDRPLMLFSGVIAMNNEYFVSGLTLDTAPPYYANAMLIRLNEWGIANSISEKKSNRDYGIFWNNLIQAKDGRLAFSGYVIDPVPTPIFALYETTADSITMFKYNSPNTYTYRGNALIQASDDMFYVAGLKSDSSPSNVNVCLIKIDINGSRIWEKFYDRLRFDEARSIVELLNGNLLIGAVRNNLHPTNEPAYTWLLEVDTGGNIVREWFDPNDSTYAAEGLLQTQDGGFIYGAQKKNFQSTLSLVSYNATIVKLDSSFSKQWLFARGDSDLSIHTAIKDIESLSDGSFIAAGHLTHYGTDTALNGYIVKLGAGGDVVWERTYRGINESQALNFLSDIDVLADGSLIAVGQCQRPINPNQLPPQVGWFLKLDSNGCEIENCLVGIDEPMHAQEKQISISLYPNPCAHTLHVQLSEWAQSGGEVTIEVLNSIGAVMYRQQQPPHSEAHRIDVSAYAQGLYAVVLRRGLQTVAVARFVKE